MSKKPNQARIKPVSIPLIGDDAPAFKATTTQGDISFPEDYKGKWVISVQSSSGFHAGMYYGIYDFLHPDA